MTGTDESAALATAAKEEFRAFVASRQACSAASDCSIVHGSCPFPCYVPVAKTAAGEVSAKLDSLGARLDAAGNRCMYRCMAPGPAACIDGRCTQTPR